MPNNPLLPNIEKTPVMQSLRTPLIVLAILIAAFFVQTRWVTSTTKSLLFHQTPGGWKEVPRPLKGYPESLHVSTGGTAWLLTFGPNGLSRWDGANWQHYKETEDFTGDFALDGEQVWMMTGQGMLHWDGHAWDRNKGVTAGPEASIVAGGGEVWVVDGGGKLSHFAGGEWQTQKVALPGVDWAKNDDEPAPRITRTEDGAVWLMRDGLWRSSRGSWERVGEAGGWLVGAAGPSVWLSDKVGLRSISMDGKDSKVFTHEQIGLEKTYGVSEVAWAGGRTLFATGQGIFEFDGSSWRKPALPVEGVVSVRTVAAGSDGLLWFWGIRSQSKGSFRYVLYLMAATPLAILGVLGWIWFRWRNRRLTQHQRVTQAVQHATGEVSAELESAEQRLKSRRFFGAAALPWIGMVLGYALLPRAWPNMPYWIIPAIGVTIHVAVTFFESLVRRKAKPSDPIGPGGASRYDWGKSWKAAAGAVAIVVLVNLDRLPNLGFLRGYWLWIFVVGPIAYHMAAVTLQNRAAKRGDYDGALKILRWANFYNLSGMEPLRMSGHYHLMAGRYREAEDCLRRSLENSHANRAYSYALEYLGDALMEQGRWDEASRSYEAALHAFAASRRPYRGMAEMVLRRGQKPDLALEYVEKILDYAGISAWEKTHNGKAQDDYWALKAWAMARLGRTSEVAGAIENALRDTDKNAAPDMASTHYRAGMAMEALGNLSAANEHFRLAIQFDPNGRRGMLAKAAMRESEVRGLVRV